MNAKSSQWELTCPRCSHAEPCGPPQMLQRLQQLGMLKRARDPQPELLLELLLSAVERLDCRNCKHVGLSLQSVDEEDWPTTRNCQACGQPISRERLDVLPDTINCASCARDPTGQDEVVEYCSKCGAVMSLRPTSRGGLTRYELACPECR